VVAQAGALLSVFIRNPEFQGPTKERLSSARGPAPGRNRPARSLRSLADREPQAANQLLQFIIERAESGCGGARTATSLAPPPPAKLRLPASWRTAPTRTVPAPNWFLVEGDSAGGSASRRAPAHPGGPAPARQDPERGLRRGLQGRDYNQELSDLLLALGVGPKFKEEDLRYERVIIMTDADVDGAHIARC
jgi:topoisomerase-4 subunit B